MATSAIAIVGMIAARTILAKAEKDLPDSRAIGADVVREIPDNLFGVALGPNGERVVTGYHGTVKVSTDAGTTWSRIDLGTSDLLRRVAITQDGTMFAVSSGGKILKGTQGGATWQTAYSEPGLYLRDIAFADADHGWAVGHDGQILHTADGGAQWQRQALQGWTGHDRPRLSGIAAIDAKRAVVVGEFGVVARTVDAGQTWTVVSANQFPTLLAVAWRGESGLAVGLNGALIRLSLSPDGQLAAVAQQADPAQHFLGVALSEDGETALIGGRGFLRSYRDGKMTAVPVVPALEGAAGRPDTGTVRLGTYLGSPLSDTFVAGVGVGHDGRVVAVGQGGLILLADNIRGPFYGRGQQYSAAIEETTNNAVRK